MDSRLRGNDGVGGLDCGLRRNDEGLGAVNRALTGGGGSCYGRDACRKVTAAASKSSLGCLGGPRCSGPMVPW